jgi:integrase
MPRERTGTIWRSPDGKRLKIRLTVVDSMGRKRRPWLEIDPKNDDAAARRIAAAVAKESAGQPWDASRFILKGKAGSALTCSDYFWKLYKPSREDKIKSLNCDEYRWKKHLEPLVGSVPVSDLSSDVLRDVVEALDRKANDPSLRTGRNRFGAKSACNCWTLLTGMIDSMVNSKSRELRILAKNPAEGVKPPDSPKKGAKQWLFPVELQKLLACEAVPLSRRRLYAVAVYCYARPGEALALLWGRSVDVTHGMVRINRSYDSRTGTFVEHTKTHDSRHYALEPVLRPLLHRMHRERKGELVFETIGHLSDNLRRDLLTAGVDRGDLHHPHGVGALPIRFHDLRATGITYMAIRGDRDNDVRERAGHSDFATTQIYIRRGIQAAGIIGDPFAPLPPAVLGESSRNSSGGEGGISEPASFQPHQSSGRRDSNPGQAYPESTNAGFAREKSHVAPGTKSTPGTIQDDSETIPVDPLVLDNARRHRRLEQLSELGEQVTPDLAFCRGLDAAYRLASGDDAAQSDLDAALVEAEAAMDSTVALDRGRAPRTRKGAR